MIAGTQNKRSARFGATMFQALHRAAWLLPSLLLLILPCANAQSSDSPNSHIEIESIRGNIRMNSVLVTIHCIADSKFSDGSIMCKSAKFEKKKADTLTLWSGNSDKESFDQTYHYMLQVEKGKKAHVEVAFKAHISGAGTTPTIRRSLYAYRLADTLLTDETSYAALDKAEVDYLVRKKGYEGKTEDEIKALDIGLWNKMQMLKQQEPPKKQ